MAKIMHSADAPKGQARYTLGGFEPFELEGNGAFETDNRALVALAEMHPWLKVERDKSQILEVRRTADPHVPREEDYLAAENSKAFDLKLAEEQVVEAQAIYPVAIDVSENQKEQKRVGDIAVTIAAANADNPDNKSRKAKDKD